ncbi:hypothetical protein Esti_001248 [Eimeria stiedai]
MSSSSTTTETFPQTNSRRGPLNPQAQTLNPKFYAANPSESIGTRGCLQASSFSRRKATRLSSSSGSSNSSRSNNYSRASVPTALKRSNISGAAAAPLAHTSAASPSRFLSPSLSSPFPSVQRQEQHAAFNSSSSKMPYGYVSGGACVCGQSEPRGCVGPEETGDPLPRGPCFCLCRWLDSFVSHCLCPPFDVAFKQRLALQRALLLLFFALSCVTAVYPFAFLSLVEAQAPRIRPRLLPANETPTLPAAAAAEVPTAAAAEVPTAAAAADHEHLRKVPLVSASALSPPSAPIPPITSAARPAAAEADEAAAGEEAAAGWEAGRRSASWMSSITFVPARTQHLYSFDRGLLYALLFWGLLLLLPCQSLLLLVALAVSRAGEERCPASASSSSRARTRLDCAAWFAAANGRMLAWNGCCSSPLLGVLSALNLSSYFVTEASYRTQLLVLAWSQLAIALLVHFPLGLHARNVTMLSEAAAALLLLQHALEAEHRSSRSPSSSLDLKRCARLRQQQQRRRQQQLEVATSAELESSSSTSSLLHPLVKQQQQQQWAAVIGSEEAAAVAELLQEGKEQL